ncbi:MAG: hypothetical protein KBG28_08570 [Kofleriaceae bacterium]|nr:hypothetical protein [Kofleriaceae bacterium]MBP6839806.1 hypothetical protein [Kofleriaceae bacterium]MBP9204000.1 hypothetical protein [Kofleriaceae bacterium]
MRRLCLLAPLLAAACLDIPPRAGAGIDAPAGGADAPPACGPPSDGVGVVNGQGCVVPIGDVAPAAAIRVVAPGLTVTYANHPMNRVPRYPSSLVVGASSDLLFINDGRDQSPADNPAQECQLENGLGQAFFPLGTAAYAPNDEAAVQPSSLTVLSAGPVVAEVRTEWAGDELYPCFAGEPIGGTTVLRFLPDGRILRQDELTVGAPDPNTNCDTTCGFDPTDPGIVTSYVALDRAAFTHWTHPGGQDVVMPASVGRADLPAGEVGCTRGTVGAVGIRPQDHPGRLNLFEGDNGTARSIALTTDLATMVTYAAGAPGMVSGQSALAVAAGADCTRVAELLADPPSVDNASWTPDNGWLYVDLVSPSSQTITPFGRLGAFAVELAVDPALPAPALTVTRGATPLQEGLDYLRQELSQAGARSVLLWIKGGLAQGESLTFTRT